MCGIYLTNIPISEVETRQKIEKVQFRGPDHTGVKQLNHLTLGHLRLSILDLDSRSNQPMNFEQFWITYNGEIYNYLDVRKQLQGLGHKFTTESDTEVLLVGFKEWGEDLLPKINGMFAFCIYDESSNTIFGARDRLGVKPFYYYWENGNLEICSQLRPIAEDKELNEDVVPIYLDTGYIPSPFSIFKKVYKLPPGNQIFIDLNNNNLEIKSYWNLKKPSIKNVNYKEAKFQLHELLKDAVKIRLQSDVPIGTFLSGGIDSSLVSAIASKLAKEKIKTFTIGFENPEYNESTIAEEYARIINSDHTTTYCKAEDILEMVPKIAQVYDEPFADSSALPSLLLNKITKQYVTVALSGDGGDESFIGYNFYKQLKKYQFAFHIPSFIRKMFSKPPISNLVGIRTEAQKTFLNLNNKDEFIRNVFFGNDSLNLNRTFDWFDDNFSDYKKWSSDLLQKAADLNIKLWLENDSNVKVDRASMAYSVEVRSPFLDYRIVEFARNLPLNYRYKEGVGKKILRDILEEYIPKEIFTQPKKGFGVPLDDWIRNELRTEFESTLNDDFLNSVPNLNVSKFKKQLRLHLKNEGNYMTNIWRLYVLKKWCDEFKLGFKNSKLYVEQD